MLIDADDSLLLVVDVQDHFLAKLEPCASRRLVQRVCWLIGVAHWLSVPIVVTVEDLAAGGGPSAAVQRSLRPATPVLDKMIFSLADEPSILAEVEDTGRHTPVLVGLETDVCIAQSALGLQALGFRPVVIADATAAPGDAHASGLARLRDAGVRIMHAKGLFYEWVRTVERSRRFDAECTWLELPEGLVL